MALFEDGDFPFELIENAEVGEQRSRVSHYRVDSEARHAFDKRLQPLRERRQARPFLLETDEKQGECGNGEENWQE